MKGWWIFLLLIVSSVAAIAVGVLSFNYMARERVEHELLVRYRYELAKCKEENKNLVNELSLYAPMFDLENSKGVKYASE